MPESLPTDLDRIKLVREFETVSPDLADWAERELSSGQTVEQITARLRRVMAIVAPLRAAAEPLPANVTQTETEFSLGWARANPELFAQAVESFQTKTPVTHWRHGIDLGRTGFLKLLAYRRPVPYASIMEHLDDGDTYLREIGQKF